MSPIRHLQNYDTKRGTPAGNQDASIDNMNKHTNQMNMTDTPTTPYYNTTPSVVNQGGVTQSRANAPHAYDYNMKDSTLQPKLLNYWDIADIQVGFVPNVRSTTIGNLQPIKTYLSDIMPTPRVKLARLSG